VADALKGFNSTVLAYGQTGSGKTFTMYGSDKMTKIDFQGLGVIPRVAKQIFSSIKQADEDDTEFKITIQMVEIYQEQIIDLLN